MQSGGKQLLLVGLGTVELQAVLDAERGARALIDRQLAETAHDMRAALAAIVGYAQLLDDRRLDALAARQIARRISRLALDLCEVSSDLLGRTATNSPKERQIRRRFCVPTLLSACAEAVEPRCREKGLSLRVELPARGTFISDASLISRVAHNLLTNAVRYTERGEVGLRCEIDERGVRFEVWDTGVGIAAKDFDRIFTEFCRLNAARRLEPLGTGLGLATVKRLCEQLGARLELQSTLGLGSIFRVSLPAPPPRRTRPRQQQAELF